MSPQDFDFLAGFLKQKSGLVLTKDKMYLLESRLVPLARKRGMAGLEPLVAKIRAGTDQVLLKDVIEAMTTNESFFFRDIKPFDAFKAATLPGLLQNRPSKSVRIWSAAASTGQEPYSLAMILKEESAKLSGWRFEIVGTDLSTEVLDRAKAGLYSQFEVQRGLPIQLMMKYFAQAGDQWQISADIRSMVQYRPLNLLDDFSSLGKFDVIFCRNVLIYFDQEMKKNILERMAKMMPPDGHLYLGGAETVIGVTERFKPLAGQRGIYVLA